MSNAKPVRPATLQFLLTDTGGLDGKDLLLAVAAAFVADGHFLSTRDVLAFALEQKAAARDLREAILQTAPLAGLLRAQQGLRALAQAGKSKSKPANKLAALMGDSGGEAVDPATQRDPKPGDANEDHERSLGGSIRIGEIFGSDAGDIDSELDDPSETLGRWLRADLYGRCFGRPGLDPKTRMLISIAAVFPLELEHHLTNLVKAGRSCGFKAPQLWHLHDLLRRLFKDGPVLDLAEKAFAAALGGKKKDDFGPGKDPFRWD